MKVTPKRGRPKGSIADKTRDIPIQIKVFAEEQDAYRTAAERDGLTMSAWIRQQLNRAARSECSE
ncbi:MAG: hypothetical protein JWP89_1722 [Schlesneria sp.]|nr:hypothetical protein [Schlesneria sp.]